MVSPAASGYEDRADDRGSGGTDNEEQIDDVDPNSAIPPNYFYAAH